MSDLPEVRNNTEKHRFEVVVGDDVALAEYRLVHGGIVLHHTEVPKAFEGKGVASRLAKAALGYAREHDLKVIPTCEFMAGYIRKHPETHDLVHRLWRERLGLAAV